MLHETPTYHGISLTPSKNALSTCPSIIVPISWGVVRVEAIGCPEIHQCVHHS